jgi:Mlc titration factor MtfA (ptsG expression regulator)
MLETLIFSIFATLVVVAIILYPHLIAWRRERIRCRPFPARWRSQIDSYGATNPSEFFAVVTETFFEKPRSLRAKYPDLYELFRQYYRLDPARQDDR